MERERGKIITQTNKEIIAAGGDKTPKSNIAQLQKILEERRKQGKPVLERPVKTDRSGDSKIKEIIKAKENHNKDEHNR
ncbi:MAG: hypothetical protein JWO06_1659 [Bacteroidota bacterium]|nr:hypothetical protein [Bacteroidota bacterium]